LLEFHSHASGSGGNFYTASDGNAVLAIECGIRYRDIQRALNFRVTSLQGCLISHGHGDHCLAAKEMMRAGVDCYASAETWEGLGLGGHRAKTAIPLEDFAVGDWHVKPFEVMHDQAGTLGFMVLGPSGKRLVYLTDTLYSPYRFEGVSILAVECNHSTELMQSNVASGKIDRERFRRTARTHMSLERLLEMLKANNLESVEEIHLLHLSNANSDEADFKRRVQEVTGRAVYVAQERCVL
jgi:phosphoribosyl 1,2-cyclic phosphodiesterase